MSQATSAMHTNNNRPEHQRARDGVTSRLSHPSTAKKKENDDDEIDPGFVAFFVPLPKKTPADDDDVPLFDRADFYSVHGPDSLFVASHVFRTNLILKYLGAGGKIAGLPDITLNYTFGHTFLREALTIKQLRVEIWAPAPGQGPKAFKFVLRKEASDASLTPSKRRKETSRQSRTFSLQTRTSSAPIIIAIKIASATSSEKAKTKTVSITYADTCVREIGVAEFVHNDLFSNTEALPLAPPTAISTSLRCGVTERKPNEFTTKNMLEGVKKLTGTEDEEDTQTTNPANHGAYKLKTHDLAQRIHLDASSARALALIDFEGGGSLNKSFTLLGLLNKCKTAQGTRLLATWLKRSLVNTQDLVETFVDDPSTRRALQDDYLKLMPDLHRLSKWFKKGVASLEDVVRVYQVILKVTLIMSGLVETLEEIQPSWIASRNTDMVETTLDLASLGTHTYTIKPEYDEVLRRLATKVMEAMDGLEAEHRAVSKDLGLDLGKKLHLENSATYGYCFRLTKNDAKAITKSKKCIELGTIKSGVYFTTKTLKSLATDYQETDEEYQHTQSGLVEEVVNIAFVWPTDCIATYTPVLEKLDHVLAHLDVIVSLTSRRRARAVSY
ncbi:hypothetical protein OG21DRAFT_1527736 [Imleria badia]|nr:hypothetical protein OG21DRAFT_1527736 [Imleria badia]